MEPLPELDPKRIPVNGERAASSETAKLAHATNHEAKPSSPPEAAPMLRTDGSTHPEWLPISQVLTDAFAVTILVLFVMGIIGALELRGRLRLAEQWASLMETAGFVDWPVIDGLPTQISKAAFHAVAGGAAVLVSVLSVGCTWIRLRDPRVLTHLILIATLASTLGSCTYLFGWVGSKAISDDMVHRLAMQAAAGANFNRGYGQAWCRHRDIGLAAFLRGDCGPDRSTVFDELVDYFAAGDWCKQAIAKQNFDLVAAYDGISPFAGLKGQGGSQLKYAPGTEVLAVYNVTLGICLFFAWINVWANLPSGGAR